MTHIISQFNLPPAPLLHEFPFFYTARHRPLNWKKDPKATGAPSPCFFKGWIIDSLRLVIYRLHMQLIHQQANSADLPTLSNNSTTATKTSTLAHTHTHTHMCTFGPAHPLNKEPGA